MADELTPAEDLMIRRVCALAHAYEVLHNLGEDEEEFDCFVYIKPFGWAYPFHVCPHAGDNLRIARTTYEMDYERTAAEWN